MKNSLLLLLLFLLALSAGAQNNAGVRWMFGEENVLDFVTGAPVLSSLPNAGGGPPYRNYYYSGAVCNRAGNLQFWGKIRNTTATTTLVLFNRTGAAMPNGTLLAGGFGMAVPLFVPDPSDTSRYYLFFIRNGSLRYSLIDMRLAGGLGDVVAGTKDVLLGTAASMINTKLTAIPGCSSVWVIAKAAAANAYYSFEVTGSGVNPVPVVSTAGTLPAAWYGNNNEAYNGLLKSAVGGGKLAAACGVGSPDAANPANRPRGGLELYDFEPCSGRLSNAVLLDTGCYFGVCFSPDNSKLYATRIYERTLWQFDLSQPTLAAIQASKTLILTNPSFGTTYQDHYLIGDIKQGPDGKLYLGNNNCSTYPYNNALHIISNPNAAGTACNPVLNAVPMATTAIGSCTGINLPAEIVAVPRQDTIRAPVQVIAACFRDSILLQGPPAGHCYRWDNGQSVQDRMVGSPGSYTLQYMDDNCRLHIHSYSLSFVKQLPHPDGSYACPGSRTGQLWVRPGAGDTSLFTYSWKDAAGVVLQTHQGRAGDTLQGLDTGRYTVRITTASGCDTTLEALVRALPRPIAAATADSLVCRGDTVTFTCTSAAPLCRWSFGPGQAYGSRVVQRAFGVAARYKVLLTVQNIEGCTDTLTKSVDVKGLELNLQAGKSTAAIGEEVLLRVTAGEAFRVLAWQPAAYFPNSSLYEQRVRIDSTTVFTVVGQSGFGCVDSAAVKVYVQPVVFIPSAFTPNGDGRNDRFRPRSVGDRIFVRQFAIYNRWGNLVWQAYGPPALEGWDGSFGGRPAESGTYFYVLDIETPGGGTVQRKGDVILVR